MSQLCRSDQFCAKRSKKHAQAKYVMKACDSQRRYEKFFIGAHVLHNTQNLVFSGFVVVVVVVVVLVVDGEEMYAHAKALFCS